MSGVTERPEQREAILAGLCNLDAGDGLDALRLLLQVYTSMSCGDFTGRDSGQFAHWTIRRRLGDEESGLGWVPIKPKWMRMWRTA